MGEVFRAHWYSRGRLIFLSIPPERKEEIRLRLMEFPFIDWVEDFSETTLLICTCRPRVTELGLGEVFSEFGDNGERE